MSIIGNANRVVDGLTAFAARLDAESVQPFHHMRALDGLAREAQGLLDETHKLGPGHVVDTTMRTVVVPALDDAVRNATANQGLTIHAFGQARSAAHDALAAARLFQGESLVHARAGSGGSGAKTALMISGGVAAAAAGGAGVYFATKD